MNGAGEHPLAALLRAEAQRRGVSQAEIASLTGISQPQISRILAGKFTRKSTKVIQLCKFLGVDESPVPGNRTPSEKLEKAVLAIWDGTREHEEAIVHLLGAVSIVASSKRTPALCG